MRDAGFEIVEDEDITENVVRALTIITPEREEWASNHLPRALRQAAREFAATEGTAVFSGLKSGEWAYHRFVARKN